MREHPGHPLGALLAILITVFQPLFPQDNIPAVFEEILDVDYEEFIRAVRQVNASLSPEKRTRLIAGDPPIDWGQIRAGED